MSDQTENEGQWWKIQNPDFISFEKRLKSFDQAPQFVQTSRNSLSQSGFFYRGYGNSVECFSCGLKLYTWIFGDCPYKEHQVFSDQCVFFQTLQPSCKRT